MITGKITKTTFIFLLLARYVPNVAKRSIWDQCNIEDRPTTDRPTDWRFTSVPERAFLEELYTTISPKNVVSV